ncbi:MAG: hypothetical protein QM270_00415 [Bacillota bacterium]|nr:hypothetical protein [Bacillota bacterium]
MARYTHNSDQKGRIVIPARLRERMGPTVYVTLSLDEGYLAVYTEERFESVRRQLDVQSGTNPLVRRLRRAIIGEALPCNLDAQGRIGISDELWSEIGVQPGDAVYLTDMGDTILICGRDFFEMRRTVETPISALDLSELDVSQII